MKIVNQKEVGAVIADLAKQHTKSLGGAVAGVLGISRAMAGIYINKEVEKGNLIKVGKTRATRYFPVDGDYVSFPVDLKEPVEEDRVWAKYIKPFVLKHSENIRKICAFGFTEILNNAIDHSAGTIAYIEYKIEEGNIVITITDNGVGIYNKIRTALNLESPREAILHLSKGKFTTDPSKHTGQGIFFTSRMFDQFSIWSDEVLYRFKNQGWLLSPEKCESFGKGTEIEMLISLQASTSSAEVIKKYSDEDINFDKTIVAVALSADPHDPHVSRSQAKRLMIGLEKFKRVILDFQGVESVGQAFVDEIFRVFKNENPQIDISYVRASTEVEKMIKAGIALAEQRG